MSASDTQLADRSRDFWSDAIRKHRLLYPDSEVIRFMARMAPDRAANAGKAALDIGCGSGRHMLLLADYGFSPVGLDFSADALAAAKEGLAERGVTEVRLIETPFQDAEIAPASLSVVIAYGVFFIASPESCAADLARAYEVLEPGGALMINFRDPESWFFGLGEKLGEGFYALDERAGAYAGSNYLFLDEAQCERLVTAAGFEIVNREGITLFKNDRKERHVWNNYWLRKPI